MEHGFSISIANSISSEKSYRRMKLKRKVSKIQLKLEDEIDYMLETQGDVKNFLRSPCPPSFDLKYENGKPVSRNFIGSSSLFTSKTTEQLNSKTPIKKFSIDSTKNSVRQSMALNKIDHKARFTEVMQKISEAKERAQKEEREKTKRLSELELFFDSKSAKASNSKIIAGLDLSKRGKINRKPSTDCLRRREFVTKKSKKEEKKSTYDYGNNMIWYMSLRGNHDSEHLESYMQVGNELSGLYTKLKKPNPYYKPSETSRYVIKELPLEIIGESKLSLEVEAVKKVGYEFLRPEFLGNSRNNEEEEMIEEQYDNVRLSKLCD